MRRPNLFDAGAVLGPVKAWPGNGGICGEGSAPRPALTGHPLLQDAECDRKDRGGRLSDPGDGHRHDLPEQQSIFLHSLHEPVHPAYAFFEQYGTETRDIGRYGIDPSTYLRTAQATQILERARHSSIVCGERLTRESTYFVGFVSCSYPKLLRRLLPKRALELGGKVNNSVITSRGVTKWSIAQGRLLISVNAIAAFQACTAITASDRHLQSIASIPERESSHCRTDTHAAAAGAR